jgi:hypothetical protein
MSSPQGHNAAENSIEEKSNHPIGNRTHDIPDYNTVLQPTTVLRAPFFTVVRFTK